ncbi:hypothetical protein BDFB_011746, partial [Asbolus verrucosus]
MARAVGVKQSPVSRIVNRFRKTGEYRRRPARDQLVIVHNGSMTADKYIRDVLELHVVPFALFLGANFMLTPDHRDHSFRLACSKTRHEPHRACLESHREGSAEQLSSSNNTERPKNKSR